VIAWLAVAIQAAQPAAALPRPAPAPPPVVAEQVSAERLRLGLELATLMNNRDLTRMQVDKLLRETMPATFRQNPEIAGLEKMYPGTVDAIVAAIGPLLMSYTLENLPGLWQELAPTYAASFTEAELRELLAFYRSPTGVRLMDAMGRGSDYSSMISRMVHTDNRTMTVDDIRTGAAGGVAQATRDARPEDTPVLLALMRSGAGRKLPAVTAKVQQQAVAWGSRPDPEIETESAKLVEKAVLEHIAKAKKQ